LHIYGRGRIGRRKRIPFGTWTLRFLDWAKDQGIMTPTGQNGFLSSTHFGGDTERRFCHR
jgi:hypothetical protein